MERIKTTLLKKARTYGDSHLVAAYRPEPTAADSTSHGSDDSIHSTGKPEFPQTGPDWPLEEVVEAVSEAVGSIVDWVEEVVTGDDD